MTPRAWTTVGHAIRHAVALGLHLRVGAAMDDTQLQMRSRTWWSLYALEELLGEFTGRPTSILDSNIAIPLDWSPRSSPTPQSPQARSLSNAAQTRSLGESPFRSQSLQFSPHLYFVYRIRLSIIGHKTRSSLYASAQMDHSWSTFQQSIREFDAELTQWSTDLPETMRLPAVAETQSAEWQASRLLDRFELAMAYQSTRMLLFRPCLCQLNEVMPYESALSRGFNQQAAASCVSAARSLLALLPKHTGNAHMSKMLPCWSLLHYLNQAGAVLILELCLKAEHMPSQVKELLEDTGKVMAWLAQLAADSLSARRSWQIFRKLYLQAAAGVGIEVVIPEDIPKPAGWKAAYDQFFPQALTVPSNQQANMQMLDHLHARVARPAVPTSSDLFPNHGEVNEDSWGAMMPEMAEMPVFSGTSAFNKRHTQTHSTGSSEGDMDWRT
jgi:Fungal specific transcription factor domain